MGNKNYSKHFKFNNNKFNNNKNENVNKEVTVINEDVEIDNEAVLTSNEVENLQEEEIAEVNTNGTLKGVVSGCDKLNIRKEAIKDSTIVTIINKNAEVVIDPTKSTNDFYKVTTTSGVEGYCMKTYITVK